MNKTFPRRILSLFLAALLSVSLAVPAFAEEGEGGGTPADPPSIPEFSVSLGSDSEVILSSGISPELTATVSGIPQAMDVTYSYDWSISGGGVAKISGGDVQTISVSPDTTPGRAQVGVTVTATLKSGEDTVTRQATALPRTVLHPGITLNTTSHSMKVRETLGLSASVFVPAGIDDTVTWTNSADYTASLSSSGANATVTGVAAGDATITATAGDLGQYQTACRVAVSDITAGNISGDATADSPLNFSNIAWEINSRCRDVLNSSLSYVSSLSVPTRAGTLYYGYRSESEPGSGVGTNENYYYSSGDGRGSLLEDVSFVPKTGFSGTAVISYTAYNSSGSFFQGEIHVDVAATTGISYSTVGRNRVDFSPDDFSAVCRSRTGHELDYITFDLPSSSRGTLFYLYTGSDLDNTVSSSTRYYRTKTPKLADVTFVAAEGYSGTVTIDYDGRDVTGNSFSGHLTITVTSGSGSSHGSLSYTTRKNRAVRFDADDFNSYCRSETDSSLNYVTFSLPSSTRGTLYYSYSSSNNYGHKVSAGTKYYRSSSYYLDSVSFVPADGWTGTAEISFSGYANNGQRFSGTITVEVDRTSSSSSGSLTYTTRRNTAVEFDRDDFDDYCEDQTGRHLNYVRFDLPNSSRGTLRYNYNSSSSTGSSVSASSNYYRTQSPYLDNVSFVPASGWTGTVDIGFTGWDTSGERFTGTVEVTVKDSGSSSSGVISYTTAADSALNFDTDDFDELCQDETDRRLNYVRFTLPASSRGTLYYNYSSSGSTGTKVSATTNYYRTQSPYLSNITFVPAKGTSGATDISFTGYDTSGQRFTGTVSITIKAAAPAGIITYSTTPGKPVTFDLNSFRTACSARGAGSFASASFTPPASAAGQLRQGYLTASSPGAAVTSSQTYWNAESPLVSDVTFVPAPGYTGAVTIPYTGKDSQNKTYSGTVVITVSGTAASSFTDMANYGWASAAVEYLTNSGVVTGTGNGKFSPGAPITRGSFMLMLCRAFHFSAAGGAGFSDLPSGSVYADAVRTAQALGIAEGSGGKFYPKNPMTRQQAAVFLTRALRCYGWTIADGTRTDLGGFSDAAQVSNYAVGPMAAMVRMGIFQGNSAGKLTPGAQLTRAQMAVILYRAVTL